MTFLSALKRVASPAALVLPALFALAACGADSGPKYPDTSSFCNARAKAECSDEVVKACAVVDATHCVAKRQSTCVAATPPGTTYVSGGAEKCITAVQSAFADAKLTAEENHTTASACALVFDGTGAVNSACDSDLGCQVSTGLRCVVPSNASKGTCQVPVSVQGGGACTSPSQQCVDGFHCGGSQHCDINGQVGEGCSDALPCVPTALCGPAGLCVSKSTDGAACSADEACLHGLCARGAGTAQGLCVAQMTLAPNEPFCIDVR